MSTFLCNFENSIVNLWNNQNLKQKCLTVIWSVNKFSITMTTRTLFTGFWLKWPKEASVQHCEKTFHPHDPVSQGCACNCQYRNKEPFSAQRLTQCPFSYCPSLCSSLHLQLDLIPPVLSELWMSKSGLVRILGTINNVSVNVQTRKLPYTEVTLDEGFLCVHCYPRTKRHGHLELKASIDINSISLLN